MRTAPAACHILHRTHRCSSLVNATIHRICNIGENGWQLACRWHLSVNSSQFALCVRAHCVLHLICRCRWPASGLQLPVDCQWIAIGSGLPVCCNWQWIANGLQLPVARNCQWIVGGLQLPMDCKWVASGLQLQVDLN